MSAWRLCASRRLTIWGTKGELGFVDGADLVGDAQHGHAAWKNLVAEKDSGDLPALLGSGKSGTATRLCPQSVT